MSADGPLRSIGSSENGALRPPPPANEPVLAYAPGSPERAALRATLGRLAGEVQEIPLRIDGREVRTGRLARAVMPHDHGRVIGEAHLAGPDEVKAAIAAAVAARHDWARRPFADRAAVLLRAAELLAGPWRATLNAATMLGQSKTAHQAEIDAACELIDFWRFNVAFAQRLYEEQPMSGGGAWNRVDYRPLEGFVFAVTPFNFTAIAGNLPTAPALMGNTVVWKPATNAMVAAHFVMRLLEEAGLPPGVINLVNGAPAEVAGQALGDPALGGVHFTGSTEVFNQMWRAIGERAGSYRSYPRVVGETGGKNFVLAHESADLAALATAIVRGGYEYQGQKCSAASRVYVPRSRWPALRERLADTIPGIAVGDVADFRNFMGAVIDEKAFSRHARVIAEARSGPGTTLLAGGKTDRERGWFVWPTLLETTDPGSPLLRDELFGPIVTVYVYADGHLDEVVEGLVADSRYALTGSVFAADRGAIRELTERLRDAAGNFYVNDKPTGAVVGQQPFGGARASGTNDKAGSVWNLIRWTSPRAIKETLAAPTDYAYPFMRGDGRA
jgi:1-pyrroline-5-carboxylate dehydrogenase